MIINQNNRLRKLPSFKQQPSILLVVAPYYEDITTALIEGAKAVLNEVGAKIAFVEVPGALEIPTAIHLASKHFSGFVALGCVIRGETSHYETVTNESSRSLSNLGLQGLCVGNGILTVENRAQARDRADPSTQDKGGGAAEASLCLLALKEKFS
jgi:6,7-dimethyl-8-ribityllumazine synthase